MLISHNAICVLTASLLMRQLLCIGPSGVRDTEYVVELLITIKSTLEESDSEITEVNELGKI